MPIPPKPEIFLTFPLLKLWRLGSPPPPTVSTRLMKCLVSVTRGVCG